MKVSDFPRTCNLSVAPPRNPPRPAARIALQTGIPLSVITAHFIAAGIGGRNV